MTKKDEFLRLYHDNITRAGSTDLLEYLESTESDFFKSPASSRFHGSVEGGLVAHSIYVYECLRDYLSRERSVSVYKLSYSDESVAIVALLHDLCKINTYRISKRNVKDNNGVWQCVPYFEFKDNFPFGHGEKSVYIINKFMKLSDEEAFAIRYHMGFSGVEESKAVGEAFKLYPLSFALSTADMEATFYMEK